MRLSCAALVAAVIAACSSGAAPPPSGASASAGTETPAPPTARAASPTPVPSPTPGATAPTIADPNVAIFSPTSGWRPTGTTLVISTTSASGATTLFALRIGAAGVVGAPTQLVTFVPGGWALRRDGGAAAIVVASGGMSRIAVWDARSGTVRWLTSSAPAASEFAPVWSADGSSLYVASSTGTINSTLVVVRADGTDRRAIAVPERFDGGTGLTPDGRGLVWSRVQAGGSVDILDLATGANRHLDDVASVMAWRDQQPRALLLAGGCCAGRPGGSLVLWDDVALTSRVVAARGVSGDPAFGSAAWDPSGTRIVAVRYTGESSARSLVLIDPTSGAPQPLARTEGAVQVMWLAEGIFFTRPATPNAVELLMLDPGGGQPVSIYQSYGGIGAMVVVRP